MASRCTPLKSNCFYRVSSWLTALCVAALMVLSVYALRNVRILRSFYSCTQCMEIQMQTWPLAVFSDRLFPPARLQNWHCRLHKGTQLSGKASVETAGSQPLVVSRHIFSLPMPLCVCAHTDALRNAHRPTGQMQSASPHIICWLSINKQSYVSGLPGKHGMCVSWPLILSHKEEIVQIHTNLTSFTPPGCEQTVRGVAHGLAAHSQHALH